MTVSNGTKTNNLLQNWPKGTMATLLFLKEQEISSLFKQKHQHAIEELKRKLKT